MHSCLFVFVFMFQELSIVLGIQLLKEKGLFGEYLLCPDMHKRTEM